MSKHTPGPWNFCSPPQCNGAPCTCGFIFGDGGEVYIAQTLTLKDEVDPVALEEDRKANARLIAAAPEMLAALKLVSKACRDDQVSFEAIGAVDDAIFEAEGGEG